MMRLQSVPRESANTPMLMAGAPFAQRFATATNTMIISRTMLNIPIRLTDSWSAAALANFARSDVTLDSTPCVSGRQLHQPVGLPDSLPYTVQPRLLHFNSAAAILSRWLLIARQG